MPAPQIRPRANPKLARLLKLGTFLNPWVRAGFFAYDMYQWWTQRGTIDPLTPGYVRICGPDPFDPNFALGTYFTRISGPSCGNKNQAMSFVGRSFAEAAATNPLGVGQINERNVPASTGAPRFHVISVWERTGATWPSRLPFRGLVPVQVPIPWNWLRPQSNPMGLPVQQPVPLPLPPSIKRQPKRRGTGGGGTRGGFTLRVPYIRRRAPDTMPEEPPVTDRPPTMPVIRKPTRTGVTVGKTRSPPGPRTKEKKVKGRGIGRALAFVGRLYEDTKWYLDVVKSFHSALPRKYRTGNLPHEMVRDLYRHWPHIDTETAVINVLTAYALEKAGGRLEQARAIVSEKLRLWKIQVPM